MVDQDVSWTTTKAGLRTALSPTFFVIGASSSLLRENLNGLSISVPLYLRWVLQG